jgi:uncharacterized protein involved in exopolysaccharide biosynthesis
MAATMPGGPDHGDVRLAAVFSAIRDARVGAICAFVLGLAASIAVAFLTPPVYRGQVVMTAVSDQAGPGLGGLLGQFGGLASLAGISLPMGDSSRTEAIALLSSRDFARGFIEEENLLPVLFAKKWDSDSGKWMVDDPEDIPTIGDAVKKFEEKVRRVNVDELTGLVTLTIDWRDRELAASWANKMVARANREMRRRAIDEAKRSIDYLEAEARKTEVAELRSTIYGIVETQIKTIMLANVRSEYAFRVVDPASVPDVDKYVWPRRALILGLGLVLSFMLALGWVFARYVFVRLRDSYRESLVAR